MPRSRKRRGERADSPEEAKYGALQQFAFYVNNVDETYERALAHSAKPYVQPDWISLGEPLLQVRNAVMHSPNGEVIEFLEEVNFDRSSTPSI
ncbi:hypothetical protein Q0V21_21405 [Paenibacillus sp. 11B]|uniref:hypothetical protein n=1 Tax=unclassified Paenibacillus TaxID=185978 RepID=UPI0015C4E3B7|nr:hypothetical protein [Paenibacillus sp. 11B]MDN8591322.1 hypothetical protein [Paenibacillus sp. 11B]